MLKWSDAHDGTPGAGAWLEPLRHPAGSLAPLYTPLSSGRSGATRRPRSRSTLTRPTGMRPPTLRHTTVGGGSPPTRQLSSALSPATPTTSLGAFTQNGATVERRFC
ncbi:hypothetical protein E2C01_039266 [Portunus trituberculatus]|uniref:Uncharacterized protein n=1 Tax=Portunus trituberculatus TaxID=210409 RepID=A0A5B7FK80_PORTR|nr:hypothetical protein [Portunus trituberculatus]